MRTVFALALSALLCASCGTAAATSQDSNIAGTIVSNLRVDHLNDVVVKVDRGRVRLEGTVRTSAERERAQEDSERVDGVRSVENKIAIVGQ